MGRLLCARKAALSRESGHCGTSIGQIWVYEDVLDLTLGHKGAIVLMKDQKSDFQWEETRPTECCFTGLLGNLNRCYDPPTAAITASGPRCNLAVYLISQNGPPLGSTSTQVSGTATPIVERRGRRCLPRNCLGRSSATGSPFSLMPTW